MIKIVRDRQLSFYDKDTGYMEYESGSVMYRGGLEDHLVTLSNGISIHVGCKHDTSPTMDDVIITLYESRGE